MNKIELTISVLKGMRAALSRRLDSKMYTLTELEEEVSNIQKRIRSIDDTIGAINEEEVTESQTEAVSDYDTVDTKHRMDEELNKASARKESKEFRDRVYNAIKEKGDFVTNEELRSYMGLEDGRKLTKALFALKSKRAIIKVTEVGAPTKDTKWGLSQWGPNEDLL